MFTSTAQSPGFQPSQILCLDFEDSHLYAELIQVVESRQLFWVRPLALTITPQEEFAPGIWADSDMLELYDLRQGVDLLWPMSLFRAVLDTEMIPVLVRLGDIKPSQERDRHAHQCLQRFIHQIWNAYPAAFEASPV